MLLPKSIRTFCVSLFAVGVLAIGGYAWSQQVFRPTVSINDIMVYIIDHNSHALWDVAEDAPNNADDWHLLEHSALALAAAGNLSHKFSLAPAMWDFVASISSDGDQEIGDRVCLDVYADATLVKADYSNDGEIRMDGFYSFDPEVEGTSFAAPRFSYYAAMYLLAGGDSECNGLLPPMGYAEEDGLWCNLERQYAAELYCQDFP